MSCCCSALRDEATHEVGQAVQPKPYALRLRETGPVYYIKKRLFRALGFQRDSNPLPIAYQAIALPR